MNNNEACGSRDIRDMISALHGLVHTCIPHPYTPCGRGLYRQGLTRLSWDLPLRFCLASLFTFLLYHTWFNLSIGFWKIIWKIKRGGYTPSRLCRSHRRLQRHPPSFRRLSKRLLSQRLPRWSHRPQMRKPSFRPRCRCSSLCWWIEDFPWWLPLSLSFCNYYSTSYWICQEFLKNNLKKNYPLFWGDFGSAPSIRGGWELFPQLCLPRHLCPTYFYSGWLSNFDTLRLPISFSVATLRRAG